MDVPQDERQVVLLKPFDLDYLLTTIKQFLWEQVSRSISRASNLVRSEAGSARGSSLRSPIIEVVTRLVGPYEP